MLSGRFDFAISEKKLFQKTMLSEKLKGILPNFKKRALSKISTFEFCTSVYSSSLNKIFCFLIANCLSLVFAKQDQLSCKIAIVKKLGIFCFQNSEKKLKSKPAF